MFFKIVLLVVALACGALAAAAADDACVCYALFDLICGTDGVTYGNDCFLACAQRTNPALQQAFKGAC